MLIRFLIRPNISFVSLFRFLGPNGGNPKGSTVYKHILFINHRFLVRARTIE